jgi:hypothetical protein
MLLLVDDIADDRLESGVRSQRTDGETFIEEDEDVDDNKD